MTKNPREAAFLALSSGQFVADWLDRWAKATRPKEADGRLARCIASGTMRHKRTLDNALQQSCNQRRLKVRMRERWLLRSALFQHAYLSKVPPYAINSETLLIAKRYVHKSRLPFVSALLHQMPRELPESPSLGIQHSYPDWFVERLKESYKTRVEALLIQQNSPPPLMARRIGSLDYVELASAVSSPDTYIQNPAQGHLLHQATRGLQPRRILDLCASPGGKTLLLAELFASAELVANDPKTRRLLENIKRYKVSARLMQESEEPFDLIVVDAPCSNSGVLARRPEARWRLNPESVGALVEKQRALLKEASKRLAPDGSLVYMTCSILAEENGQNMAWATDALKLQRSGYEETLLPNQEGFEGGYACLLKVRA